MNGTPEKQQSGYAQNANQRIGTWKNQNPEAASEFWKDIPGYEGFYQVSNMGSVRRVESFDHKMNRRSKGRVLKPGKNSGGYLVVILCKKGIAKTKSIHQLVCSAFYGIQKKGVDAMHLDGNKENNQAENLRYGSRSCNMAFTLDDGTALQGIKNHQAKLTNTQVKSIRDRYVPYKVTFKQLAKEYGVCMQVISKIVYRQTWGHVE